MGAAFSKRRAIGLRARACERASLRRAAGITLVELLVVIGIIAVLMAILLPVLGRARESAHRAVCLSNIHQVATAFIGYTSDNRGSFPFCALAGGSPLDADWVWWQRANNRIDAIADHGIGPYLNLSSNPKVLYCPSDDRSYRPRQNAGDPFPFSYVLNNLMTSAYNNSIPYPHAGGTWGNIVGYESLVAAKITQVRQTPEKILVFDADERAIVDGSGCNYCIPNAMNYVTLLALRHDAAARKRPDVPPASNGEIPNKDGRGIAAFCDGHADYVERAKAHSKNMGVPDASRVSEVTFAAWK